MVKKTLLALLACASGPLTVHAQAYSSFLSFHSTERQLYDHLGYNCEVGKNLVVMGAPEGDVAGKEGRLITDAGFFCVYERLSRGDWKEPVKIPSPAAQEVGHFAQGLALRGTRILVGEPFFDARKGPATFKHAGRAWLYFKDDFDHWRPTAPIQPDTALANACFGTAVALTDSSLFVSAPSASVRQGNTAGAGAVYVFRQVGDGFKQRQVLAAPVPQRAQQFGNALVADNQTLIIAAHHSDKTEGTPAPNSGAVFIYQKTEAGTWALQQTLRVENAIGNESFGTSLALDGNCLVVGAPTDGLNTSGLTFVKNAGAAYVYRKSPIAKKWVLEQKIVAPTRLEGDIFGFAVSTAKGTIAITAPSATLVQNGKSHNFSGTVYLFEKSTRGNWGVKQQLQPTQPNGNFGSSVKLFDNWLGIGAYRAEFDANNSNPLLDAGAGYLFQK